MSFFLASFKSHFDSLSKFLMELYIIPVRNIFPICPHETMSSVMTLMGSQHLLVNKGLLTKFLFNLTDTVQ